MACSTCKKFTNTLLADTLVPRGTIESASGDKKIETYGQRITMIGKEEINTGVFECSPGTYRRSIIQAEIMHILKGNGVFTEDGKDPILFNAGDTLFFSENTEGEWVIESQLRKVYVILP